MHQVRSAFIHIRLFDVLELAALLLLLSADREDVIDGVDDLSDLLLVLVLAIDLILEVLLEGGVLLRDLFKL